MSIAYEQEEPLPSARKAFSGGGRRPDEGGRAAGFLSGRAEVFPVAALPSGGGNAFIRAA
jgi:hypothetical protein